MAIDKLFVPKELDVRTWTNLVPSYVRARSEAPEPPVKALLDDVRNAINGVNYKALDPSAIDDVEKIKIEFDKAWKSSMADVKKIKDACLKLKGELPKWQKWAEPKGKEFRDAIKAIRDMQGALSNLLVDLDQFPTRLRLEFDQHRFSLERGEEEADKEAFADAKKARQKLKDDWKKFSTQLKSQGGASKKDGKETEGPKIGVLVGTHSKGGSLPLLMSGNPKETETVRKLIACALEVEWKEATYAKGFAKWEDGKVALIGRGLAGKASKLTQSLKKLGFASPDVITRDK